MSKTKEQINAKRQFIKTLESIAYRHSITNVFDDFMELAICAFAMGTMEERYHEIAKRYSRDELNQFAVCLALMINEYQHAATDGGWNDMLGIYYEEIGSITGKQQLGQFFTPKEVCDLMARLNDNTENAVPEGTTVCDPAAGSSRNLIAHSRLHPQNRWNTFYHGYDLDRRCVNMSVLNMIMYGMKGVVIHMNTLSLEVYSGYRLYLPELGWGVRRLTKAECWNFITITKGLEKTTHEETTNKAPIAESNQVKILDQTFKNKILKQASLF